MPWASSGLDQRVTRDAAGTGPAMKLMKSAAAIGIAKTLYDQARKPANQAKIKSAMAKARSPRQPHGAPSRMSRITRRPH